ncbi:hypothetical protein GCM10023264_11440 [Sphingomonas daechungensis]|uniref:hypothetical protein n=1 Tax=Sphingomonas daechungensis TaxID=1176646 RepID=UPI0031EC966D
MSDKREAGEMRVVVNAAEAAPQSRLSAIRLVSMTLRMVEQWRALIGDQDCVMIMLAVAVINTESLDRATLFKHGVADLRSAVPPHMLRRCTISSVALATGLNRETTRRKVTRLVEHGFLAREADGHVYLHPSLDIRNELVGTIASQLETFAKTANELLRDRTLIIRPG